MNKILRLLAINLFTLNAFAQVSSDKPYENLPQVPAFTLTSIDMKDSGQLGVLQMSHHNGAGGMDVSPQLAWSGFPPATKSFVLTVFDPDAPIRGGFWHWEVINIPVATVQLPTNAGKLGSPVIPPSATTLLNGANLRQYLGAAPPKGTGKHRYVFAIHALDIPKLELGKDTTPETLCQALAKHSLARATLTPWAQHIK